MRLSRLGSVLATVVVALSGAGMWFSLQGNKVLAGVFIGVSVAGAIALNIATKRRVNRLTRC